MSGLVNGRGHAVAGIGGGTSGDGDRGHTARIQPPDGAASGRRALADDHPRGQTLAASGELSGPELWAGRVLAREGRPPSDN
jgi:hypothetical protein